MERQKITFKIGHQEYHTTVGSPEEEQYIRRAEKLINKEYLSVFTEKLPAGDPADFRKMTLLDIAVKFEQSKDEIERLTNKLTQLNQDINKVLITQY